MNKEVSCRHHLRSMSIKNSKNIYTIKYFETIHQTQIILEIILQENQNNYWIKIIRANLSSRQLPVLVEATKVLVTLM